MRETKTEAKTIQDAVEKGLAEMGLRRDQVEVVVVSEGKSGFLGIGAKKACVILREKRWGENRSEEPRGGRGGRRDGRGGRGGDRGGRGGRRDGRGGDRGGRGGDRGERSSAPRRPGRYGYEDARLPPQEESRDERPQREDRVSRNDRVYKEEPLAQEYLGIQPAQDPVEHGKTALLKMLSLMGVEATVSEARLETAENLLFIRFDCADPAVFTEDNGRGLQALQFLLNSMVSRKREPHLALRLDTGGYWDNKEKEIADRVEQAVTAARAEDRPQRLDPMPASMRKIVHNLVKSKYPDMETVSEGEGRWRKVSIRKADKPQQEQSGPAAEQQSAVEPQPAAEQQPAPQPEEQAAAQPVEQTTTEQK